MLRQRTDMHYYRPLPYIFSFHYSAFLSPWEYIGVFTPPTTSICDHIEGIISGDLWYMFCACLLPIITRSGFCTTCDRWTEPDARDLLWASQKVPNQRRWYFISSVDVSTYGAKHPTPPHEPALFRSQPPPCYRTYFVRILDWPLVKKRHNLNIFWHSKIALKPAYHEESKNARKNQKPKGDVGLGTATKLLEPRSSRMWERE